MRRQPTRAATATELPLVNHTQLQKQTNKNQQSRQRILGIAIMCAYVHACLCARPARQSIGPGKRQEFRCGSKGRYRRTPCLWMPPTHQGFSPLPPSFPPETTTPSHLAFHINPAVERAPVLESRRRRVQRGFKQVTETSGPGCRLLAVSFCRSWPPRDQYFYNAELSPSTPPSRYSGILFIDICTFIYLFLFCFCFVI